RVMKNKGNTIYKNGRVVFSHGAFHGFDKCRFIKVCMIGCENNYGIFVEWAFLKALPENSKLNIGFVNGVQAIEIAFSISRFSFLNVHPGVGFKRVNAYKKRSCWILQCFKVMKKPIKKVSVEQRMPSLIAGNGICREGHKIVGRHGFVKSQMFEHVD